MVTIFSTYFEENWINQQTMKHNKKEIASWIDKLNQ